MEGGKDLGRFLGLGKLGHGGLEMEEILNVPNRGEKKSQGEGQELEETQKTNFFPSLPWGAIQPEPISAGQNALYVKVSNTY